ncbi:MAG: trehalose utilization protein ThuA [Ruminococcaceae bacterium]|nr:trehalose utilization protein ThuA [Oscillospiraceae bacterium]
MKVTVWNEYLHEKSEESIRQIYPDGIHGCIAKFLTEAGYDVKTATLDMPEAGLTDEVLNETDVLFWWGHIGHESVPDEVVEKVYNRVIRDGMGLIVLHSGHASKIFRKLMGTSSDLLKWRESNDKEILWVIDQSHPIAQGIDEKFILEHEETYGEHFLIPQPDELVFVSWFSGGEVFRSGCTFKRGRGKIFYFRPGHESVPTYHDKNVQKVLINAVEWAYTPAAKAYNYGWAAPTVKNEND